MIFVDIKFARTLIDCLILGHTIYSTERKKQGLYKERMYECKKRSKTFRLEG